MKKKSLLKWIAVIVGLSVLIWGADLIGSLLPSGGGLRIGGDWWKTGRVMKAREAAIDDFAAALARERSQFAERVDAVCASEFESVRTRIDGVVARFGHRKCWEMCKALAMDNIKRDKDSPRFRAAIDAELSGGFYEPLLNARMRVLSEAVALEERLRSLGEKFGSDLKAIPELNGLTGEPPVCLQEDSLLVDRLIGERFAAQATTVVGGAVEAVFLKRAITSMKKIFRAIVSRQVKTFGTAAVVSQLDSPVPGPMDVIAVGIASYGMWKLSKDIKAALVTLPRDMGAALEKCVDGTERDCLESVKAEGERIFGHYEEVLRAVKEK